MLYFFITFCTKNEDAFLYKDLTLPPFKSQYIQFYFGWGMVGFLVIVFLLEIQHV